MSYQTTGRRIKPNDSTAIPRYIIAVDCSGDIGAVSNSGKRIEHCLKRGSAVYTRIQGNRPIGTTWHKFTKPHDFWQLVTRSSGPRRTVWIIGHCILAQLKQLGFQDQMEHCAFTIDRPRSNRAKKETAVETDSPSGICVIDSPPTIIGLRCQHTQGRVLIVDLLNWWKLPLSELSEVCGLKEEYDFAHQEKAPDAIDVTNVNVRVVMQSFLGLIGYVQSNNMGMFRYTATGQAYSCYRHRGMKQAILCHDNPEVKAIERQAYFGARTQVFRRGPIREDVWQYDVNSLFPYNMMRFMYPRMLTRYQINMEYGPLPDIRFWDYAIAEVSIETSDTNYPLRVDKHVAYPRGKYRSTLCGPELRMARESGEIKSVKSWAEYECSDLFSLWVKDMYALRRSYRENGDKIQEYLTKVLMNCLYGKFGQMSPLWKALPDSLSAEPWSIWPDDHPVTGERTMFRAFGWDVYYNDGKKEMSGTFTAISAFITAYSRVQMNALREICGAKNVYYQGCDSLIVNRDGHDRLNAAGEVHGTEMGKLKLICQGNFGDIYGQHDYRLGDKVVIAGRANNITRLDSDRVLQHRFSGTASLFNPVERAMIVEKLQTWQRSQSYAEGETGRPTWVEPLEISG